MSEGIRLTTGHLMRATFELLGNNRGAATLCFLLLFAVQGASSLVFYLTETPNSWQTGNYRIEWSELWWLAIIVWVIALAVVTALSILILLKSAHTRSFAAEGDGALLVAKGTVVYVITTIGIILGLIALIIPGLILLSRWIAAVPLALRQDISIRSAISRSYNGTRGSTLAIGVCLVIFYLPSFLFSAIDFSFGTAPDLEIAIMLFMESGVLSITDLLAAALSVVVCLALAGERSELTDVFA
ncbi:MAG: hypothetical protein WA936_09980 [Erythrobacter sp.]